MFTTAAHANSTHSAKEGTSVDAIQRRQDRDLLVKRLADVVSRSSVARPKGPAKPSIFRLVGADDTRVKEAETQGIPASVSLVALRVENGLTPKELFDLVNKLKNDVGADAITADARELARRLLAPPSKLRELYKKADGSFDLDALLKDLGLDGAQFRERAEALKKALEEDPTAPLQEETVDPTKATDDTGGDGTVDPNDIDPGEGTIDPSQFDLGEGELDDTVVDQDDFVFDDDAQAKLDEEARQKAAAEAAKNAANNEKNGKNGKDGKGAGAAKAPPPPPPPISMPPISAGGGGEKGQPPPPLPMPPPPEIPPMQPFQMPPPPPGDQGGLSPELLSLLLAKGKTGEKPPDAGMQDILQTFAAMNQQTIQAILQLGSTMLAAGAGRSQITATPPAGAANVYGRQGSMTARIQSSSGLARTTTAAAPRTSVPGNTIANSMQAQSPREGTVPGFSSGSIQPRTSGASPAVNQTASSEARWIAKPRR